MGSFTTYGRKLLLGSLFVAPAPLGDTMVALTSVIPGTADDVTRLVEPSRGGYLRASYPFGLGWTAGQPGEVFNTAAVTFVTPTDDWGTIRGWALLSSDESHVIAAGQLRQATAVKLAMSVVIVASGIRAVLR